MTELRAPFPYFGGKSRVADEIWRRFGTVENYIEPFAGSLAVLLARPAAQLPSTETVNDADGLLANFWRAMARDPAAVAAAADWPVNECDLHARHLWLVGQRDALTARLMADPEWYDAKAAGWWVWGVSCWIGSGWCSGDGPWVAHGGEFKRRDDVVGDAGMGVHRKLPHLGDRGTGVHCKLPLLSSAGRGVPRQLPALGGRGNRGRGVHRTTATRQDTVTALATRLACVRVACGDWSRVVSPGVLRVGSPCGILLDPPYTTGHEVYANNDRAPALASWEWAVANGNDPKLRIAYCCHDDGRTLPGGWMRHAWKPRAGYGRQGEALANAAREVVYFSPHCAGPQQRGLFDAP